MRQPWLGLTSRQVSLIQYVAIASMGVYLTGALVSLSRRGQEISLTEMRRLGGIRVTVVAHAGAESIGTSTISVQRPHANELWAYLPLLAGELEIYPSEALKRCNLREVIVCDRLMLDGKARMATYDVDLGRLYLVALGERERREYARHAIHHELFHMIDYRDDGHWDTDPAWEGLNAPGFKYGAGGQSMQDDPSAGLPDYSVAGFLNAYSRSDVAEDKAEIFAHLMTRPRVLEARAATDAILSAKQCEMSRLLERFCPGFDKEFWKRLNVRK
jgi:hypothetical protein